MPSQEHKEARVVELSDSSWQLLDQAVAYDPSLTTSDYIEAQLQSLLADDGGELVNSLIARSKLKALFGNNHG